ncbi:MAG: chemotaxis protein CheD [Bacteroidales bacterium]
MNIIVGIADMKISFEPDIVLITYGLGSCIGMTLYDPFLKVGGLLHFMLPDSKLDTHKGSLNPLIFADTAIPIFFEEIYRLGVKKERLEVRIAGGSHIFDESGFFNIGRKNYLMLKKILRDYDIPVKGKDIGGKTNRTLFLEISTGRVFVKTKEFGIKEI